MNKKQSRRYIQSKPAPLTPEQEREASVRSLTFAWERFRSLRDQAKQKLDEFADRVKADPSDAMRWAEEAFDAAGTFKVCDILIHHVEEGRMAAQALEMCTEEALRHARYPSHSTSMSANRHHQAEGAAFCEALDSLRWMARTEAELAKEE